MNLILIGPPCSGKGTQSKLLADHFSMHHISTGDLLRAEMAAETPIGKDIKELMDAGQYVDDETVMHLAFQNIKGNGNIFDGFPRTIPQAEALLEVLAEEFDEPPKVVVLDVREENLVNRLSERAGNDNRSDDDFDIFRERISTYWDLTAPVIEWLREKGLKVFNIDSNYSVPNTYIAIVSAVEV